MKTQRFLIKLIRKLLWSPDTKLSIKIRTKRSGLTPAKGLRLFSFNWTFHISDTSIHFIFKIDLIQRERKFYISDKMQNSRIGWKGPKSKIVKFEVFDIFWQELSFFMSKLFGKVGWKTKGKMFNDSWIDWSNFLNSPPRRSFSHWLDVFFVGFVLLDN